MSRVVVYWAMLAGLCVDPGNSRIIDTLPGNLSIAPARLSQAASPADEIDKEQVGKTVTLLFLSRMSTVVKSNEQHLQDLFLNTLRKERIPVSMFLVNGIKLVGHIESFDQYVVMLRSSTATQLVYKHAISTVFPTRDIKLSGPAT